MKILILYLCFLTAIVSAQEETQFAIKDNLFKVGLFNNSSLSDNLTLQNVVSVRKDFAFVTLDVPVLLKYNISNEWSIFLGAQTRTIIKSNFLETYNIEKPLKSNIFIETDYDFKHNTSGNITFGFPLEFQFGLKF